MAERRRDGRIKFIALGTFVAVFLFSFLAQNFKKIDEPAGAASLANFDPGYIISDYQMGNYNSMTEAEIQAFLTKKNPCSNTNYTYYQQLTAWNPGTKWHFENGHFICLSEEKFGDGEVIGSGETAAHIIWQASQDYKINPQALIVLIQKETSLITDPIPNNYDYRKATGYGCPDTAPCSSEYYGFKNQVRKAAALFSTVLNGGWTNYPLGENYIQYNPNSGCGGSVVNIRSLATSALYRYTPYQPNAGALAAGYGTAYCGAYGNRNFYLYFEDWFGGVTSESEKYTNLDFPRYMSTKSDVERINYIGEVVDNISQGTVLKFTTKTISRKGLCLRTEFSTVNNIDACILMSDLQEISLDYEKITENNNKIVKAGAKKIYIRGESDYSSYDEPFSRPMVLRTTFNGKTYYITEFDSKNSNSEYGFIEEDLEDMPEYERLNEIKNVKLLNNGVLRTNILTGERVDTLLKNNNYNLLSMVKIDDKVYYRTAHNTEHDLPVVISEKDLMGSIFVDLDVPREFNIKESADRFNPLSGEVFDVLTKGKKIKIQTKALINNKWFYRTEHNTVNDLFLVISAEDVE